MFSWIGSSSQQFQFIFLNQRDTTRVLIEILQHNSFHLIAELLANNYLNLPANTKS